MASEAPTELATLVATLKGIDTTKYLAAAVFSMSLYEYMTTLDNEVKYFWDGPWTISRVLFLLNRYVPLMIMMLDLEFLEATFLYACTNLIRASFIVITIAMTVVQLMLTIRIWHLFRGNSLVRALAVFMSASCQISAFVILGVIYGDLNAASLEIPGLRVEGCVIPAPKRIWRLWVPALILHTLLYVLTAGQGVVRRNVYGKRNVVLNRLLRDGGLLYLVVLVSVGFSGIGSSRSDASISVPAVYSNLMVGLVSVCMSRVMFSIHDLADNLNCQPEWLLNHIELSRVNWKKGSRDGELLVEMDVIDEPEHPVRVLGGDPRHELDVRTGGTPESNHDAPFLIMS